MKAKRNQYTIVPLELCDDNDNVVVTVPVRTDYIAMRNRLMESLGTLQKLIENGASDEEIGAAVLELIKGLYGEEGGLKIVEFFGGDYTALVAVVTAHIYEDIQPALNRILEEKRRQAKAYGAFKKH